MISSVLFDILVAIQADIQALALPGLATANVVIQKAAGDRPSDLPAVPLPCVLIAPHGSETLDPLAGTNLHDDIVYPVRVTILANDSQDQAFAFRQFLGWREALRRSFHNQRLSQALCFTVRVQPLAIVDRAAWIERHLFASALVLNCVSREARGT